MQIVKRNWYILHININTKGDICLDILKKDGWRPSQNLKTLMLSIYSLLSCPNPDDPFNSELAAVYRNDESKYHSMIKEHCQINALTN